MREFPIKSEPFKFACDFFFTLCTVFFSQPSGDMLQAYNRAGWAKYPPDSSTGQSELVLLRAPGQYNLYVGKTPTYTF